MKWKWSAFYDYFFYVVIWTGGHPNIVPVKKKNTLKIM